MTPAEFKTKWAKVSAKESAAYQSHFDDLCRLLKIPPPLEADPTGEFFCFQKRVVKDEEQFVVKESGEEETDVQERGFADVWKKGCFAWEYKGKKKNLDEAYKQLLRYRESLLNPPLLVVCDFDRFIIRTNFNGTVQETFEFRNSDIDLPANLRLLRLAFTDPDALKPQRTTAEVTEKLAAQIAEVAKSLQKRESHELADAKTRAQMNFAQRKNLRIARFLNRVVFCFFAEDTGLLPKHLFSELARSALEDSKHFAETLEKLFEVMATGGSFGPHKIRHFNGHLFEESTVFELTAEELRALADAGEADWQFIQPSIMGTLFERALEPEQRSQLGAHYTSEEDIKTLVEPVLMAPLRREWSTLKNEMASALAKGKGTIGEREKLATFQQKLATIRVLDPACGSGNFLYVSLQLLLDLEKMVITCAAQLDFRLLPRVTVQQLLAIEINPYAYELAQVSVQIGYLQWRRDNGFDNDRSPVLQNLDGFQNEDALLVPHFHSKAKSLKQAQAGEHAGDDALKFYTEREWPECDIIVGNPPFLGGKLLRRELRDTTVDALFEIYGTRVEPQADLCCYWFEKARTLIENKKCQRAGLLATQGIRGGANREVLKRIKEMGDIFFAISDRRWVLAGAAVHVSMVGFDDGSERMRTLDGQDVSSINSNLSAQMADITRAQKIAENSNIGFMGDTKVGPFEFSERAAEKMLAATNPHGRPNSDVVRPWINGLDLTRRPQQFWNVDFPPVSTEINAARYESPFEYIRTQVKPMRATALSGDRTGVRWFIHQRPRPEMRLAVSQGERFVATATVSKYRLFAWYDCATLPDHQLIVFARSDDYFFGVLHSRFHEVWALKLGTRLETRPRYTPTTCFETFPFPRPTKEQEQAIAGAAKELNELRERWLNPPEWTVTRALQFPGSTNGPWSRLLDPATVDPKTGLGTVRYSRLEPRDADCAAKLKKRTLTNLYNERPAWLAHAHEMLDAAVAAAYGLPADLTDEQILERLLALNLERAAAEHARATKPRKRTTREKREDELL